MTDSKIEPRIISTPIYEVGRDIAVTGRKLPAMTFISNELVPGSNKSSVPRAGS